jgi:hypothetical protein
LIEMDRISDEAARAVIRDLDGQEPWAGDGAC